jgi:hypothetical protein
VTPATPAATGETRFRVSALDAGATYSVNADGRPHRGATRVEDELEITTMIAPRTFVITR